MQVTEPTQEEVASILAAHPHRFPSLVHITVPGDRGVAVRLPFILGNPTGACAMPPGRPPTTIWNSFVTAALSRSALPEGEDAAAQDALLFPALETWAQWADRWPALAGQVWKATKRKCGAILDDGPDPAPEDPKLPPAMKAALERFPRAALRRYQPKGASLLFLIDPPASAAWRIFMAAVKDNRDVARNAGEMAQVCTRAIVDEKSGEEVAFEATMRRWPGLAVLACLTVSVMAGAATAIELGE